MTERLLQLLKGTCNSAAHPPGQCQPGGQKQACDPRQQQHGVLEIGGQSANRNADSCAPAGGV
jgi:hypothetical protein